VRRKLRFDNHDFALDTDCGRFSQVLLMELHGDVRDALFMRKKSSSNSQTSLRIFADRRASVQSTKVSTGANPAVVVGQVGEFCN
jgi:hypothetical protein